MTLTTKQRAFVEAYLSNGFNATKAALTAGYSARTARSIASENLTKPNIQKAIDQRISQLVMTSNEVLARLSDHARATLADFIGLDESEIRDHERAHLLKKYRRTVRKTEAGDEFETVEFELHDPQAALIQLGRHHKLFTDRLEVDPVAKAIALILSGEVTYEELVNQIGVELAADLFNKAGVPIPSKRKT